MFSVKKKKEKKKDINQLNKLYFSMKYFLMCRLLCRLAVSMSRAKFISIHDESLRSCTLSTKYTDILKDTFFGEESHGFNKHSSLIITLQRLHYISSPEGLSQGSISVIIHRFIVLN